MEFLKKYNLIILIMLLGFALRAWGILYDLPLVSTVGDELPAVSAAAGLWARHSLIPEATLGVQFPLLHYVYALAFLPYLLWLLVFGGFNLLAVKQTIATDLSGLLLSARFASLFLGVASIYLIYYIANKLFKNKSAAGFSALLFALEPLNVVLSHFARVWGPQEFFILLSLAVTLRCFGSPKKEISNGQYFLTALFIVLSVAVNLSGLAAYFLWLLVLLVYHCGLNWREFFRFLASKKSVCFHALLLAGLALIMLLGGETFEFYRLIFFEMIYRDPNYVESGVVYLRSTLPMWQRIALSLYAFWQYETAVLTLLPPALFFLFRRNKQAFWFSLAALAVFYLCLNPPLISYARPRFLAIMMPFLILPAAWLASEIFLFLKKRRFWPLSVAFLVVLVAPSLFLDLKNNFLMSRNSTSVDLYYWLKDHLKPGERVFVIGTYLQQELLPTSDLASRIKQYSPEYYSARFSVLDRIKPNIWRNGYDLYSEGFFCRWPNELISQTKFKYVVISENSDLGINLSDFKICGLQPVDLSESTPVFSRDTSPYFKYSLAESYVVDDNLYVATYDPLLNIKRLGPRINVYEISQ